MQDREKTFQKLLLFGLKFEEIIFYPANIKFKHLRHLVLFFFENYRAWIVRNDFQDRAWLSCTQTFPAWR